MIMELMIGFPNGDERKVVVSSARRAINRKTGMKELVINVEGMMCKHCKAHVENALLAIAGVKEVEASLENNNATIKYEGEIDRQVFVDAIIKAGYEVK